MDKNPQLIPNEEASQFTTQLRRLMPAILAALGVTLVAAGITINYIKTKQNNILTGTTSENIATIAGEAKTKTIKIDIEGAVQKPGVVEVPYDSRIKDVLISAGGLTAKADRIYLSKSINLAQQVSDGMKIYIPFQGEVTSQSVTQSISNTINQSALININDATASELDTLPGIGPVTAEKIISNRPYQKMEELVEKRIVSQSTFNKIKDKISLY